MLSRLKRYVECFPVQRSRCAVQACHCDDVFVRRKETTCLLLLRVSPGEADKIFFGVGGGSHHITDVLIHYVEILGDVRSDLGPIFDVLHGPESTKLGAGMTPAVIPVLPLTTPRGLASGPPSGEGP